MKECPFCGGDAEVVQDDDLAFTSNVECTECSARTLDEDTWNERI